MKGKGMKGEGGKMPAPKMTHTKPPDHKEMHSNHPMMQPPKDMMGGGKKGK